MPQTAETDEEIERCFSVISELRTHLREDEFLSRVREMESGGYRLAYIEKGGEVVAVTGYRITTNFFMGRHLYVEDLVTAQGARSQGHGETLIAWLRNQATSAGCRYLDLDSGTQRRRAHKFYFQQGLTIASYHFSERLGDGN